MTPNHDPLPGAGWSGRRVLVTGAAGFIGSHLARNLVDAGAEVFAVVRGADPRSMFFRSGLVKRVTVVSGSVDEPGVVERVIARHEPEVVFHLAAEALVGTALRAPVVALEANVRATYLLLEACRRQERTVKCTVVASSDKAYGQQAVLPYTEDMGLQGRHPYDVSKSCADLIAQSFAHTYGLPVVIARCGNVFGGGDLNWSRLIPGTVRSCLRGEPPVIRSDGSFVRDYIYIADVVRAYLLLAERALGGGAPSRAYNFGNEKPVSVRDLVHLILGMTGCEELEPIVLDMAQAEIHSQFLSAARARVELEWAPQYDLESGLAETVEWYREYLAG